MSRIPFGQLLAPEEAPPSKKTMTSQILQFFAYNHLPEHLQKISKPFSELAESICLQSPDDNPEREMALRKLLEAKDCAVRAYLISPAQEKAK